MKEKLSVDFRKSFLISFTEELIIQSIRNNPVRLQEIINIREQSKGKFPKQIMKALPPPKKIVPRQIPVGQRLKMPITRQLRNPTLEIPEPQLPLHLQYLKPVPTNIEIDLYKITPLIKDPTVRIIEGNPDSTVLIVSTRGTKQTDIFLNKEDIERIISKFSEISKIPISEGVYRIVVGNLSLSAIISRIVGSRFIIKKLAYPITKLPRYPQQHAR